jgi:hypothetical protein
MPDLAGVPFKSWKEAAEAEDKVREQKYGPTTEKDQNARELDRIATMKGFEESKKRAAGEQALQGYQKRVSPGADWIPPESVLGKLKTDETPIGDTGKILGVGLQQYTPEEKMQFAQNRNLPAYEPYNEGVKSTMEDLRGSEKVQLTQARLDQSGKNKSLTFSSLSPEEQHLIENIAKRRAEGTDPPNQYIQDFPAFGGRGAIRAIIDDLTYEYNPDFDATQANADYLTKQSHARTSGTLTPDIIHKRGELTHTQAKAQLEPDVVTGKVGQQARGGSARLVQTQRMAAQKALSTFDDAYDAKIGTYRNINDPIYTDLMLDYARILAPGTAVGSDMIKEIKQGSLRGDVVGAWNRLTGNTETVAPDQVLHLMHDRIAALNVDLDKQYYNLLHGTELPINSNPESNPLKSSSGNTILDQLKEKARQGDTKAQAYLRSKGMQY